MFKFHKNHKRTLKLTTEMSLIRTITALSLAGVDTVWALYMHSFGLGNSTIGFISASLIIISLITSFYSTIILEKFSEYKIFLMSLLIHAIAYLLIGIYQNLYFFLSLSIVLTILAIFRINSFDILFRDKTNEKTLNEEEGLLYTLLNLGWFIGPLISGLILGYYGMRYVFFFSSGLMILSFIIFKMLDINIPKKTRKSIDSNIIKNIKDFIKNPYLDITYAIGAGVEIWYALIYIYVPLFMIENGLKEEFVGYFLSIIIIPLILFEYKISKISEKKGFKLFFTMGFLSLGISLLIAFYLSNMYYILLILVIAHIAMAALEPLQDSYFFKQVKSNEEEKFYPIYATSGDIGAFLGKCSIAIVLLFLPQNYAFLTIAIFMFLIAGICLKIKK